MFNSNLSSDVASDASSVRSGASDHSDFSLSSASSSVVTAPCSIKSPDVVLYRSDALSSVEDLHLSPALLKPIAPKDSYHQHFTELKAAAAPKVVSHVAHQLADTMRGALNDASTATMLPSLISTLPSGKEKGTYLSVDVGGSTLRIALVALKNRTAHICASAIWPINASIKSLSRRKFFLWIGKHIRALLAQANITFHLNMGLSWSFPIAQLECVAKGTILTMGKGYHVADQIAGRDLGDEFAFCFQQLGLDITLTAIVNDTIASLLSHSYVNPSTRAAVILGTGVNSAVVVGNSLINTEMSLMGEDIFPATKWDVYLDKHVERPGFQPFETKVSGRYLGEVARLVLVDLRATGQLGFSLPKKWQSQYGLPTPFMSELEGLFYTGKRRKALGLLSKEVGSVSELDLAKVASVFLAVSDRAAAWMAASIVALGATVDPSSGPVTVAYSGTVLEKYSGFKERCERAVRDQGAAFGLDLRLEGALDGTLYGPAIASAMYA